MTAPKIQRWTNVPGMISIEPKYCPVSESWYEVGRFGEMLKEDLPISPEAAKRIDAGASQILIYFTSTGYSDPGRTYGPPEDCYPPEVSDDRELVRVTIDDEYTLPPAEARAIFDRYADKINAADLNYEPPCPYED